MTKKQQKPATVDDEREFHYEIPENAQYVAYDTPEIRALIESGIIEVVGTKIIFRAGHLEHLALEYVRDPVGTWRDYHDDVEVAQTYCLEQWDKLINGELH